MFCDDCDTTGERATVARPHAATASAKLSPNAVVLRGAAVRRGEGDTELVMLLAPERAMLCSLAATRTSSDACAEVPVVAD